MGGQSGAAVTRSHGNDQDVGWNPAAACKNKKSDIGETPPTEGGLMVWTGSKWKTGDVKPN